MFVAGFLVERGEAFREAPELVPRSLQTGVLFQSLKGVLNSSLGCLSLRLGVARRLENGRPAKRVVLKIPR